MTKQKVLDRFNEVVDIAAKMIQEQSTDFIQWLHTCYTVYNRTPNVVVLWEDYPR